MSDWRLAGLDQVVVAEFYLDNDLVIPDAGSVYLTVRGPEGLPLSGLNHVLQPDSEKTTAAMLVPAINNALSSGNVFEARFIEVDFTYEDRPLSFQSFYNISAFVPLQVTFNQVRAKVGAAPQELPDADLDLKGAYFRLLTDYPSLAVALTTPGRASQAANNAVAIQAVLDVFPSLQARLMKMEETNSTIYQRAKVDMEQMEADLTAEQAAELAVVAAVLTDTVALLPTPVVFVVSDHTDPITG